MKRRPVVEIRQRSKPYRQNPERILIDSEAGDEAAADARADRLQREHDRDLLNAAYAAYARRHGWPEARGWAAAQAHFDPAAKRDESREAAELAFSKKRRAA